MVLDDISRDHIIQAIELIDKEGIKKGRHSSTYDVDHNGKLYPPKLLISLAHKFAFGEELSPEKFDGGINTQAFKILEKQGFNIIEKSKITLYDILYGLETEIEKNGFKLKSLNEKRTYVWVEGPSKIIGNKTAHYEFIIRRKKIYLELHFENSDYDTIIFNQLSKSSKELNWFRWNNDGKSIRFSEYPTNEKNLSQNLISDLKNFDDLIGDDVRSLIKNLKIEESNYWIFQGNPKIFDLEGVLKKGILNEWSVSAHKNEIKIGDKIIFWMTGKKAGCYALGEIINPPNSKSTSSEEDEFWKRDDKIVVKAGVRVTHNLVNTPILNSDILNIEGLKNLKVGNQGTNFSATKDEYDLILKSSQINNENMLDILNKFISQSQDGDLKTKNYPKKYEDYDMKVSFGQGVAARIPWIAIYKHPNKVSKGVYPVYLYYKKFKKLVLAYGISETEEPIIQWPNMEAIKTDKKKIKDWAYDSFSLEADRYGSSYIKAEYDLTRPLDSKIIESDLNEILSEYSKLFKKYWLYAPGEDAAKWDEFYDKGIMGLGWDEIGDLNLLSDRDSIKDELKLKYEYKQNPSNNSLANYEFRDVISIGDIIIAKRGRQEYLGYGIVTSDYFYDNSRETYQKCRKVDWKTNGIWIDNEGEIVLKTLTDITKYPNYVQQLIKLLGIEKDTLKEIPNIHNLKNMHPLNTILYGPPGTGKTHNTILRAAEIIANRKIDSYDEALKIFNANLHNQIEFITFHQNYSYEEFVQGLRPETDNKSSLVFCKKDGVFKEIADKALENLNFSQKAPEELSSEALFNKALELFSDKIYENEDNYKINDTAYIFEVEEDAFRYTGEKWTNHANGLRMKFSDLKEFYRKNVNSRKEIKTLSKISGLANQHATYYYLVYSEIMKYLPKKTEKPQLVTPKNFVIIIDEINRANISRVFGELITLIEPDKRSNGAIPLEVRLPSGDFFIVPSNLYIIGTMNTADKSIALLDIALRRRFEFEPMYPKYKIDGREIPNAKVLEQLNTKIIETKGHDFQIGHAYFMDESTNLVERMNKKVIPLLLEYYMNDEKEVKQILNYAGLKTIDNSWPLRIE